MRIVNKNFFRDRYIQKIIENFDWDKTHQVMKFMNWQWVHKGVPSIEQLKESSIKMLEDAYDKCLELKEENMMVSSGGLKVEAFYSKDLYRIVYLGLEFILNGWNLDEDDLKSIDENKYE